MKILLRNILTLALLLTSVNGQTSNTKSEQNHLIEGGQPKSLLDYIDTKNEGVLVEAEEYILNKKNDVEKPTHAPTGVKNFQKDTDSHESFLFTYSLPQRIVDLRSRVTILFFLLAFLLFYRFGRMKWQKQ